MALDLKSYCRERVLIIVEAGCNYENDLDRAKEMIRVAAEAGADAVKFQTFIAEKLMSIHAEKFWEIAGCPGETALDEFRELPHLTREQYVELKECADDAGIMMFSTPEDETSFAMLDEVGMPMWKMSSMNITHKPLLDLCCATAKPVVISTGASNLAEIAQCVQWAEDAGCADQLGILHCISNYPTDDGHVNLNMITHLRRCFPERIVGYSDHTIPEDGEGIITAAVALGARIIEKHYTFDSTRPGYDHEISVDYEGLRKLVKQVRRVDRALGSDIKRPIAAEGKARIHARRSLTAHVDIPAGTVIERSMIEIKRPGLGIEPRFVDMVVGRTATRDIVADTQLTWDMI